MVDCCCHRNAGSELVKMAIREMIAKGCEEVVLEAEVSNTGALKLYQALGFVRDKRLHRCGRHTGRRHSGKWYKQVALTGSGPKSSFGVGWKSLRAG